MDDSQLKWDCLEKDTADLPADHPERLRQWRVLRAVFVATCLLAGFLLADIRFISQPELAWFDSPSAEGKCALRACARGASAKLCVNLEVRQWSKTGPAIFDERDLDLCPDHAAQAEKRRWAPGGGKAIVHHLTWIAASLMAGLLALGACYGLMYRGRPVLR